MSRLTLLIALLVAIPRTGTTAEPLSIRDREVYHGTERFIMRGVCYAPTPIGRRGTRSPRNDFFTRDWRAIYQRDLPAMRAMGVNCVRVYGWDPDDDHREFLDLAWNEGRQPIRVLISHHVDPATDWRSARTLEALKRDWGKIALRTRDHPATLGYLIGNELNQARGNPALPWLWRSLNEVAGEVRRHAGTHLITTALADVFLIEHVQYAEREAPNFNAWCAQVYRGDSFKTLFADHARVSSKPLFVTEFGIDAHDARRRGEYPDNARIQAEWIAALWGEIAANSRTASGGAVFSWCDEWWKVGSASRQDPGGWLNGAFPDGQADEEWWGLHRVQSGRPDKLIPRAAAETLRGLWSLPTR